tara:strand:- start:273 stop:905 length:633 start_codon:yes stop_codon:yes gene_type:complete
MAQRIKGPRLRKTITKYDYNKVRKYAKSYAKYIVRQAKKRISQKDKVDTGWLRNSLAYRVKWNRKGFIEIEWYYAKYGEFIDKGVQGLGKGNLPPNSTVGQHGGEKMMPNRTYIDVHGKRKRSRFKFKTPGMPPDLMEEYVRRKGIQIDDMTVPQMAFLIGRGIKAKGIKGISFYTQPLSWSRNKFNKDLESMIADDLRTKISKDLKIKY